MTTGRINQVTINSKVYTHVHSLDERDSSKTDSSLLLNKRQGPAIMLHE